MNKTIIVSNRLPLQVRIENDQIEVTPSVGGLATGLKSVHKEGNGLWVGWSGITEEELTPELENKISKAVTKAQCVSVNLTQRDLDHYYYGFSNRTLWPLFHYFIEYTEYNPESWEVYKSVNQKFADKVLEHVEEGDNIWIQDYQLLLVPAMVKAKRPDISIGFFNHIPFPSYEIFRTFPKRKELLEGMLGADLIGFHTYDYERHFLSSVKRILSLDVSFNKITYQNRIIKVDSFPMGIDYEKFENAALDHDKMAESEKSEIQKRLDQHLQNEEGIKMILSIDRMDYTKGIPNRIKAFEYFLRKYPQFQEKIRLIMLAVPSRSQVPQYQRLKQETDELVGRINGEYSTVSWTPIWYFYRALPFENLIDLYTSSDVALITPVRDGMNLVAKEYVATRTRKDGVLVLSEMAGASIEMNEALLINPFNFEEIADSIKQALEMPKAEQKQRMQALQNRVSRYSVKKWANEFMNSLDQVHKVYNVIEAEKVDENVKALFRNQLRSNEKKIMFLDYDGTLVNFTNNPQDAKPDKELFSILEKLYAIADLKLVLISGRDKKTLNKWFGHTPYTLVSDHGVSMRIENEEWKTTERLKTDWMDDILPVLETFVDRTPGTLVEKKKYSLAWHYRNTDIELAEKRLVEIKTVLTSFISNTDLTLLEGNKVIEIKSSKVNKGRACSSLLNQFPSEHVFAFGDDWTDEFMFEELPERSETVKIGVQKTKARYYVKTVEEVRAFLKALAE
ncbi:bifunctional alpha,alpha-trehalose-phosphate synthase (UDP-forming)/trehalose-phosphatase [Psychroflexus sp. CAK57W]|uniref:bifunctional alpha,alpha-trehalose-phosphate synthase (UDP-forming)/trehalose-phosphatase n=1 Tax=Psychroflexus curvus TaxID=2873595 RepID=UPI001CCEFDA8|nr:bifunctional alpha,alpha-trehalose-phosphate synthase (UDP-forming)/trehalose-phosphatase [Psychroflexus curvus]MBZ9787345.1 bifunctional alpha,alpha-trehalose-phosphate synthase (UDP-forming)/trehalose-phosphatase [Psychroflexus curvus]